MERDEKQDDRVIQVNISGSEILEIFQREDMPKIYANGFIILHGNADVNIVWQQQGRPVGISQMSFTLAKTLVQKLGKVILDLEQATEHEFLTTDEIDTSKGA